MTAFLPFEAEAIRLQVGNELSSEVLDSVLAVDDAAYDYTGWGYFLRVKHPGLPAERSIPGPAVVGVGDGVLAGFVVFLQNNELTLECHGYGDVAVPPDFRERDVKVSVAGTGIPLPLNDSFPAANSAT